MDKASPLAVTPPVTKEQSETDVLKRISGRSFDLAPSPEASSRWLKLNFSLKRAAALTRQEDVNANLVAVTSLVGPAVTISLNELKSR